WRAASKVLDHLKTSEGQVIIDPGEVREHAVAFYRDLFVAEPSCPDAARELHVGLLRLGALEAGKLEQELSLAELAAAAAGLASGKAPGLDGLPAEFYKAFWPLLSPCLLRVFQESLADKVLLISCRRAVLTLLPKKGDLGCIKNWWPVSLLCADYKILAKALATRLRTVMASITGPEQSYCVPGRTIQDNLFLLRLQPANSLAWMLAFSLWTRRKPLTRWTTPTFFGPWRPLPLGPFSPEPAGSCIDTLPAYSR
uniref:Reverse transcriptase domain-containing protein n=1 Tax=Crocodylus porosus TaxID=8502 RepID=A0A7M4EA01_CROPO